MAQKKISARLRAEFKEVARQIISVDRMALKHGRSQNTIGAIERAMVDAFQLGQELGLSEEPYFQTTNAFVDWIEIPPRARDTLSEISFRLGYGENRPETISVRLLRLVTPKGIRWVEETKADREDARSFSAGGINPLIKLALLAPVEGNEDLIQLTEKGVLTCKEYWRRSDERDPTLPKMSVRAW